MFSRLNSYLTPPTFVGTQWLRLKAAVDKNNNEKIVTNEQLFVKFVNIFAVKILCYTVLAVNITAKDIYLLYITKGWSTLKVGVL